MSEAVVPIVIVSHLPPELRESGDLSALALLGSKRLDLGVLFWKLHAVLPKLLLAFKQEKDRKSWLETSQSLKKMKEECGVKTSSCWYNRDTDIISCENLGSHQAGTKSPVQEDSNSRRRILQEQFEDLENIFGSDAANPKVEDKRNGELDFSEGPAKSNVEDQKWKSCSAGGEASQSTGLYSNVAPFISPTSESQGSRQNVDQDRVQDTSEVEDEQKKSREEEKVVVEKLSLNKLEGKDFFQPPPPLRQPRLAKFNGGTILSRGDAVVEPESSKSVSKSEKNDMVQISGSSIHPKAGSIKNHILDDLRKLQAFVAGKDLRKSEALLAQACGEVDQFIKKIESAEAEVIHLRKQLESLRSDDQQSLQEAEQINRVLTARNSSLLEESKASVSREQILSKKMKIICEIVKNFSNEKRFQGLVEEVENLTEDNDELELLVGLKKFQKVYSKLSKDHGGNNVVNIGLEDGQTVSFSTNRNNNIGIFALENFLSKKVVGFQVPVQWGGGYKEMDIINGYVNCPPQGWGDKVYRVVTQDRPVHLGQGCSYNRGQRLGGGWNMKR